MREIDLLDAYDFLLNNDVDEPIAILKNGKPQAALIPYDIFLQIRKHYAPEVKTSAQLSPEDIEAIMNAEIPVENAQFDDETEEK